MLITKELIYDVKNTHDTYKKHEAAKKQKQIEKEEADRLNKIEKERIAKTKMDN